MASKNLRDEYSVTVDWAYRGDRSMVPHHLALEIAHGKPPSGRSVEIILYISFLLTGSRFL
jgi:hypothetical protein